MAPIMIPGKVHGLYLNFLSKASEVKKQTYILNDLHYIQISRSKIQKMYPWQYRPSDEEEYNLVPF